MSYTIQEDCIGIVLTPSLLNPATEAAIDLTGASTVQFILKGPAEDSSDRLTRTGSISGDPTLGVVTYTTVSGDFNTPGTWKYQVWITFGGGAAWKSEITSVKVKANL